MSEGESDLLFEALKGIYRHFNNSAVHGVDREEMPLDAQKAYLKRFPEPADDYERSYFKYLCFKKYCYYKREWQFVFYNIVAMVIYPFVYRKMVRKGIDGGKAGVAYDAVFENVPNLPNVDVLPDVLREEFKRVMEITEIHHSQGCLVVEAQEICKELRKRYFWHFYFRLIVMLKLAQYGQYLQDYAPRAIAFYSVEREFAGPLLTLLCEARDAQYIAYMHGDYLYTLCFAFQRYSRYYIWDEAYARMFTSLRCSFPMELYVPEKMRGIAHCLDERDCGYFATYYFSAETREYAEKIHDVFAVFERHGLRCKVRPHPRFSDLPMLKEVFADMIVEDPHGCALADSITDCVYTVGLNTTVLSQAHFSKKKVAIDDVSQPGEYLNLERRGYIMMQRPHELLSALLQRVERGELSFAQDSRFMKKDQPRV